MNIIRDEELCGLLMIPLLVDWRITRCNVRGCRNEPNTIVTQTEAGIFGLCEECYQKANTPDGCTFDLVFDNSDRIPEEVEDVV